MSSTAVTTQNLTSHAVWFIIRNDFFEQNLIERIFPFHKSKNLFVGVTKDIEKIGKKS